MQDGRARISAALCCALGLAFCLASPRAASAQDWAGSVEGSTTDGPTVEQYLNDAGPDVKYVEHGQLKIDGKAVNCGKRPTVIDARLDSWGGSYPGYLILNPNRLRGLATPVKFYVYYHECGHQFVGATETGADCYSIRSGVKAGWLDGHGLDQICAFISQLKGDGVHPPGPQRCQLMRQCYAAALRAKATARN